MSLIKKVKTLFKKKKEEKKSITKSEESNKPKSKSSSTVKPKVSSKKRDSSRKSYNRKNTNNKVTATAKKTPQNSKPKSTPKPKPKPKRKLFSELGLDPRLVEILNKNNFETATTVQAKSIPVTMEGRNVFCSSETGSGKTLSFLLPMVHKFYNKEIDQALIICPTREIAIQTQKVLQMFNDGSLASALVIGGTDMEEQKKSLREYPNILVATPGRLLDMLRMGLIWLQYTGYVVLDEADRMLDMGFEDDLIKIHKELSGDHQTVLFSATLFPQVKRMAKRYASDYAEIIIGKPTSIAGSVEHVLVQMKEDEKFDALKHMILKNRGKMIVFCNTIREVDSITRRLKQQGVRRVNCIHSKRDQATREQLIADFRTKYLNVLLASDVAARGIDIPNVELVVNYELPNNSEEYIHRVGRTGRAGKTGKAVSFYSPKDKRKLLSVEKMIKSKIKRVSDYKTI